MLITEIHEELNLYRSRISFDLDMLRERLQKHLRILIERLSRCIVTIIDEHEHLPEQILFSFEEPLKNFHKLFCSSRFTVKAFLFYFKRGYRSSVKKC